MKFWTTLITTFTFASKFRWGDPRASLIAIAYIRSLQLSALSFTHSLNASQFVKVKVIWNWNFRRKRHKQVYRLSLAREWTPREGKSRLEWKNSFPRSRKLLDAWLLWEMRFDAAFATRKLSGNLDRMSYRNRFLRALGRYSGVSTYYLLCKTSTLS